MKCDFSKDSNNGSLNIRFIDIKSFFSFSEFLNSKSTASINYFIRSEDKSLNNFYNETVKLTYIFLILLKINFSMQLTNFYLILLLDY